MRAETFSLERRHLAVCLGPGGVGKTTLSAALAIVAASAGRAVNVMTVDPAPRLLDALGLDATATEPQTVPLKGIGSVRGGTLRALRLDPKRTFDLLIARHAPSDAVRDAILADRIYSNLSSALAGVADYMAFERLLELYLDPANDLVVLDTPPAAEAIDFLEAPRRMIDLLNSRAASLLGASRGLMRGPLGMLDLAARAVLAAFDRVTGLHLLSDVQNFVRKFEGMYEGFADRARQAEALLRDPNNLIVLVTTAESERVTQAREFISALDHAGLKIGALVVNRIMPALPERALIDSASLPSQLKRKLRKNLDDFAALKRREAVSLKALRALLPPEAMLLAAPDLGREPRTLRDLAAIGHSIAPAKGA